MSFFFGKKEWETPLTEAVISNNVEEVKRLSSIQKERQASNYLGFNGIELARYLDQKESLAVLDPLPSRQFKVLFKGNSSFVILNQKEYEEFFHIRYLSHLRFDHYELLKKAIQACPWISAGGERKEEMQHLFITHQQKIYQGYVVESSIRWVDEKIGYGLFAERHFKEGEYVGEYCGELHPRVILHHLDNTYCFQYTCGILPFFFLTINSKYAGNELRFANHSYTPNMVFKAAFDKGLMHVLFFTQKEVKKGEQFTYDYGEDYWRKKGPPVDL